MRSKEKKERLPVFYLIRQFAGYAWHCKPSYFIFYVLQILINAGSPFVNIIFPAYIIDELVGERRIEKIILYTALTVGINAVCGLAIDFVNITLEKYGDLFGRYLEVQISEKCVTMDFQHTEDKKALEQLEKAKTGMSWYSGGIDGILSTFGRIVQNMVTLLGVVAILVTGMPWLLLIYVVSVAIDTFLTARVNRVEAAAFQKLAKENQVFGYIFWELQDIRFGKDIRLYGAEPMMEEKSEYHNSKMTEAWKEQEMDTFPYREYSTVLAGVQNACVILLIGVQTLKKVITIGDFTMYYNAGNSLRGSMQGVIGGIQDLYRRLNYAREFQVFMEYPNAVNHGTKSVPECAEHTVEFKNVSFSYPGSNVAVLKNISVVLHPGEHISIVGLNGAGKTTFIKLLCRLYDPTEGEILLDGVDIREIDYEEYVKLMAVVFQDFQLFPFTARENVTLKESNTKAGDIRKNEEKLVEEFGAKKFVFAEELAVVQDEGMERVLEQTGLTEAIGQLKYGADTYIMKGFDEEGTEMSGGQQQKLAIARALYKDAPIVILDEPTAALDPIAEYEIYRQFHALVGGKTAIYISHRLSSCQFCDIIYVFADGTIKETGTHEELVQLPGGRYAKMFEAQAQYYR